MIVTQSGKLNGCASGGSVIPVEVCTTTGVDDVGPTAVAGVNLFEDPNMRLPTDGEVNIFASVEGPVQ